VERDHSFYIQNINRGPTPNGKVVIERFGFGGALLMEKLNSNMPR
jgi:hypothetical protein